MAVALSFVAAAMYVVTVDRVIAYDLLMVLVNGAAKLWTKRIRAQQKFSSAVQAGDTMYLTVDQAPESLHVKSGQTIWSKSIPTDSGNLASTPLVRGDKIVLLDDVDTIHSCSAKDGIHLWRVGVDQTGLVTVTSKAQSTPDGDDIAL